MGVDGLSFALDSWLTLSSYLTVLLSSASIAVRSTSAIVWAFALSLRKICISTLPFSSIAAYIDSPSFGFDDVTKIYGERTAHSGNDETRYFIVIKKPNKSKPADSIDTPAILKSIE